VVITTIVIAFPIGVGAAIYLEEYTSADPSTLTGRISRIIEINIRNLAGVPWTGIGLLGLAIFVARSQDITSRRTILSASLTMALLILPVIIINAQEAIRAVPSSLREYQLRLGESMADHLQHRAALGAARHPDRHHPGDVARHGETAPLIIIGASTSSWCASGLRSEIHRAAADDLRLNQAPQQEFRDAAAAGIVVLLVLLLVLNATAIVLRPARREGGARYERSATRRPPRRTCRPTAQRQRALWTQAGRATASALQHRSAERDHRLHRPVRLRQEHGAAVRSTA
jgi:phosphate transport system permease protein